MQQQVVAYLIDGRRERGGPCELDERRELPVPISQRIQAMGRGSAGEEVENSRVLGCGLCLEGKGCE